MAGSGHELVMCAKVVQATPYPSEAPCCSSSALQRLLCVRILTSPIPAAVPMAWLPVRM